LQHQSIWHNIKVVKQFSLSVDNNHIDFNESPVPQDNLVQHGPKRSESNLASSVAKPEGVRGVVDGMKALATALGELDDNRLGIRSTDNLSNPVRNAFGTFDQRKSYLRGCIADEAVLAEQGVLIISTQTDEGSRTYLIGRTPADLDPTSPSGRALPDAGNPGDYLLAMQTTNPSTGQVEQSYRYLDQADIQGVQVAKAGEVTLGRNTDRQRQLKLTGEVTAVRSLHDTKHINSDTRSSTISEVTTSQGDKAVIDRPVTLDAVRAALELAKGLNRPIDSIGVGVVHNLTEPKSDSLGEYHTRKDYNKGCDIHEVVESESGTLLFRTRTEDGDRLVQIAKTPDKYDPSRPGGNSLPNAGQPGEYLMVVTKQSQDGTAPERSFRYLDAADIRDARVIKGQPVTLSPNLDRRRQVQIGGEVVTAARLK
jgi:hypothetical protein